MGMGSEPSLTLALRYAWREMRGGLVGFRIFLACLALGVAAIAGVGSVASALTEGLAQRGQEILGGDVDVRLLHRSASPLERAFLGSSGQLAMSAEMRAMARSQEAATLVELKAVENAYPLYGAVTLEPAMPLAAALGARDGVYGIVAERNLVSRLGVEIGGRIALGNAEFELRAIITQEPDRVGDGFALGPRIMMSYDALATTALVQPGSLISYHYRLRLPENARSTQDIEKFRAVAARDFPQAGWRIQDRSNGAPGMRRLIERVAMFLSFAGLATLVVGGVGIANAVKAHLDSKRNVIAVFKCLGAPGRFIFSVYLAQALTLATLGIVVGLLVGACAPFVVQFVAGERLPVEMKLSIFPVPLALGAAYGVLTTLAFSIWPLARAREIPASSLFRDLIAPERAFPPRVYIVAVAFFLILLSTLAVQTAENPRFVFYFILGCLGAFVVLWGAARLLMRLASSWRPQGAPDLRLALANLYRPGAPTPSVMLSLGIGLSLLVTVSLIQGNLVREMQRELPDRAPSFFFLDIQSDQSAAFETLVRDAPGIMSFERVPMLQGRIVSVKGVPAHKVRVASDVAWALRGDRGVTYSRELPKGSRLVQGEWWPSDYQGPLLVSLTEELARGMGLQLGDEIEVNILGRLMTAKLASTREVDWRSLGINFVLVFSPGALEAAPHTELATVSMAEAGEERLELQIADRFPNVSSIRIKDALKTISNLMSDFSLGLRSIGLLTLAAGVLVLAGAMAAGFQARARDAAILKTLGATRPRILGIYLREYALTGLATALVASLAGTIASWAVVTRMLEMSWAPLPLTLLGTVMAAMLLTMALGLAASWRAMSLPAARMLRGAGQAG